MKSISDEGEFGGVSAEYTVVPFHGTGQKMEITYTLHFGHLKVRVSENELKDVCAKSLSKMKELHDPGHRIFRNFGGKIIDNEDGTFIIR